MRAHAAKAKTYQYRMYREGFVRRSCAVCVAYPYPLDEGAMAEAAKLVVGADFTRLAAVDAEKNLNPHSANHHGHEASPSKASNVRRISSSRLEREGSELIYTCGGMGFSITWFGIWWDVACWWGKGRFSLEDIPRILEARTGRRRGDSGGERVVSGGSGVLRLCSAGASPRIP